MPKHVIHNSRNIAVCWPTRRIVSLLQSKEGNELQQLCRLNPKSRQIQFCNIFLMRATLSANFNHIDLNVKNRGKVYWSGSLKETGCDYKRTDCVWTVTGTNAVLLWTVRSNVGRFPFCQYGDCWPIKDNAPWRLQAHSCSAEITLLDMYLHYYPIPLQLQNKLFLPKRTKSQGYAALKAN
jgi:hypothetical protein